MQALPTFLLQRILWRLRLWDVDNAVHVERNLFGVGAPPMFVVEAVDVFAVRVRHERVITVGHAALVDLVISRGVLNLEGVSIHKSTDARPTYPEVDLEIPATTMFSITGLECDGHLVVLVEHLVEALALVCL